MGFKTIILCDIYIRTNKMKINTIYIGDNLQIMKDFPSESIDLIYLDPPFFTQRDFIEFDDRFKNIDYYISWMKNRLIEMYRILKLTGSIYLHVDWRTVHYLKIEMDKIFGYNNFQNEIIWHYGLGGGGGKKTYSKKHDNILYYSKSKNNIFNIQRGEITPQMKAKYCHTDEKGKYMISKNKKYYLKGGKLLDDVWDISSISPTSYERTGYPTQKPEKLLERIIKTSSNPNSIILDPFVGSGTTCVIAEKLGRKWIGIDINPKSQELINKRISILNKNTFKK